MEELASEGGKGAMTNVQFQQWVDQQLKLTQSREGDMVMPYPHVIRIIAKADRIEPELRRGLIEMLSGAAYFPAR